MWYHFKNLNNHPVTNLKNTDFCDIPNKEFKLAVLR